MKRRTVCQILLSVFGLGAGSKQIFKLSVKSQADFASGNMSAQLPLPCITNEMLDAMFEEMTAICQSVLATVDDPAVVWRVHVQRHHMQHNVAVFYVAREMRSNGVFEVHTGHTGISILEFPELSASEKLALMEKRVGYMLEDMEFLFRREIDANL